MADVSGKGLHGGITDNPLLKGFLDAGNWLRYGMSEDERQEMVRKLQAPGVEEAAFAEQAAPQTNPRFGEPGEPQFIEGTTEAYDPAAAERYTSAYLYGKRFAPPAGLRPLLHHISGDSRQAMSETPIVGDVFGVGPERDALRRAEELGMARGAEEASPLMRGFMRGLQAIAGGGVAR